MASANLHLKEYAQKKDIPIDCYAVYDMHAKKVYAIKRDKYVDFVNFYFNQTNEQLHLTMDLAFARTHSLVFDIDIKFKGKSNKELVNQYITHFLKPVIASTFCQINCFTVIICQRPNSSGLHVHFPEFLINHDDYILLCTELQPHLENSQSEYSMTLDIVKNFNLSYSSKPNTKHYVPFSIYYFENTNIAILPLYERETFERFALNLKKSFKNKKINSHTLFRELLSLPYDSIFKKVYHAMMPVVIRNDFNHIIYSTFIGCQEKPNCRVIGHFTFMDKHIYQIYKTINFTTQKSLTQPQIFKYLVSRRIKIGNFVTENYALKQWFKQSQSCYNLKEDIFKGVNELIIEDNVSFLKDEHPLRTIMEFDNGYYFLPVFYALCNHLNLSSSTLVSELSSILKFTDILFDIDKINDSIIKDISKDFTIETILYCGSNLTCKINKFADKLENVILEMKNMIESSIVTDDLSEIIVRIVARYIPIMVASLKDSCMKPKKFMWNIIKEQWQEFANDGEIKNIVININNKIKKVFKNSNPEIVKCCNRMDYNIILAIILSESNIERVKICMDQHKWHLKTSAGVLDLLTGHVGGTVPEFYLSDINLGISLTRNELMNIKYNQSLIKVYRMLTSEVFFRRYLESLFLDVTDDFHDTLKIVSQEFGICDNSNECIMSMLNFYVHLCKYMSFEYPLLMFMIDILSSMLIATNYARHFYILQGITGNGKSKFFEMLSGTFEGYCQSIRNVNLQPGKGIAAQPEFAAALFCKRSVFVEEMHGNIDENLIKELSGNSFTSFRKLYENNQGGIPTAKLMASTNKPPRCTATEAFKRRVIPIPFNSEFKSHFTDVKTSHQVEKNHYKMETGDSIVNNSIKGLFLLIYIHLRENIDMTDGYLHIRKVPDIIEEFKEFYMSMTSVYMQFKQFADVQILPDATTSENDLISAIRQFLTETKRAGSIDQQQIMREFGEEFKKYKTIESQDSIYDTSALDDYEEDEPIIKKKKMVHVVYYDGIAIKNLKKSRN